MQKQQKLNTMKFILFITTILLSSAFHQAEDQHILQAIMDSGHMESFVDTTAEGKLEPIVFMTNGLIPDQKAPMYKGASIVVSDSKDVSMEGYTVIEIVKYKRTPKKCDVSMLCNEQSIRMKFKDLDTGWEKRSFKLKGRKVFNIDKEF